MQPVSARLFIDQELTAGLVVRLEPPQAHYLHTVMRLRQGGHVAVFNGREGEWTARLGKFGKGWGSVELVEQRRPQADDPGIGPWLLFAPLKRARIDFLAQKATELGAAVLWPVWTEHTAVDRVNQGRLRANAIEAAEQCGRLTVPEVRAALPLGEALAGWPDDPATAGRRVILCAEKGAAAPIAEAAAALRENGCTEVAILTGPEGGFAPRELDGLVDLPFVTPVGLGPRILRADTAALAAFACWQAVAGDGRQPPHHRD
jgi:16S rRNA (uracil1498-N3)-methyltransferase